MPGRADTRRSLDPSLSSRSAAAGGILDRRNRSGGFCDLPPSSVCAEGRRGQHGSPLRQHIRIFVAGPGLDFRLLADRGVDPGRVCLECRSRTQRVDEEFQRGLL